MRVYGKMALPDLVAHLNTGGVYDVPADTARDLLDENLALRDALAQSGREAAGFLSRLVSEAERHAQSRTDKEFFEKQYGLMQTWAFGLEQRCKALMRGLSLDEDRAPADDYTVDELYAIAHEVYSERDMLREALTAIVCASTLDERIAANLAARRLVAWKDLHHDD